MAPIEKREVTSLPEGEQNNYKNVDELKSNDDLKREINDDFFDKLESGDATIERHKGTLIIKIRDKNALSASMVNINGEAVGGYSFRIKERTLKNFLEKEQTTAETSAYYNTLLNKLQVVKNTQNELLDIRQNIDFNIDVTKQNLLPIINSIMLYYSDINTRMPRTFSRDSRKGFLELKNKAASRYKILKNIKYDLERRSYSDITQYINKTKKYLEETQEFDHNWQKVVMKQYPGDISVDINNTTDAKKEKRYQKRKFNKNNKFNSKLENAEILDEANETMEIMQRELIDDLDDTSELIRQIGNKQEIGEILPAIENFKNKANNVKSIKELRHEITNIVIEIESLEKKFKFKNLLNKRIKNRIIKLKNKYKTSNEYRQGSYEMKKDGSYAIAQQRCERGQGAFDAGGELFSDTLVSLGLIDESDTTKKEAWKKFGKVGILALGAFAIYKIFTSKGKARRARIGGSIGGLLALKNKNGIKNWYKDAFGSEKPSREHIYEQTHMTNNPDVRPLVDGPLDAIDLLGTTPINTLIKEKIILDEKGHLKVDYDAYIKYINGSPIDDNRKKELLENIEKYRKNNDSIENGLSLLGFNSIKNLESISGNDDEKTILDGDQILDHFESLSRPINAKLNKEGLKPVNLKAWYKITQEYKNKNIKISDLIKRGLLVPNKSVPYDINHIKNNKEINLDDKTINGFIDGNGKLIYFNTYGELFNAVNLNNFMKKTFKNKTAKSFSPFNIDTVTRNIEFDNQEWYKIWKNETNAINSNLYQNTLEETSTTLADNKHAYIKYLNNRWNKTGSVEK